MLGCQARGINQQHLLSRHSIPGLPWKSKTMLSHQLSAGGKGNRLVECHRQLIQFFLLNLVLDIGLEVHLHFLFLASSCLLVPPVLLDLEFQLLLHFLSLLEVEHAFGLHSFTENSVLCLYLCFSLSNALHPNKGVVGAHRLH